MGWLARQAARGAAGALAAPPGVRCTAALHLVALAAASRKYVRLRVPGTGAGRNTFFLSPQFLGPPPTMLREQRGGGPANLTRGTARCAPLTAFPELCLFNNLGAIFFFTCPSPFLCLLGALAARGNSSRYGVFKPPARAGRPVAILWKCLCTRSSRRLGRWAQQPGCPGCGWKNTGSAGSLLSM